MGVCCTLNLLLMVRYWHAETVSTSASRPTGLTRAIDELALHAHTRCVEAVMHGTACCLHLLGGLRRAAVQAIGREARLPRLVCVQCQPCSPQLKDVCGCADAGDESERPSPGAASACDGVPCVPCIHVLGRAPHVTTRHVQSPSHATCCPRAAPYLLCMLLPLSVCCAPALACCSCYAADKPLCRSSYLFEGVTCMEAGWSRQQVLLGGRSGGTIVWNMETKRKLQARDTGGQAGVLAAHLLTCSPADMQCHRRGRVSVPRLGITRWTPP
jgi:hypothetical protein